MSTYLKICFAKLCTSLPTPNYYITSDLHHTKNALHQDYIALVLGRCRRVHGTAAPLEVHHVLI